MTPDHPPPGRLTGIAVQQTPTRLAGVLTTTTESIEVRSPFTGDVVGLVPNLSTEQVDVACRAALIALERDDFPQHARARVLENAARLIEQRIEDFARTIAMEAGKPIRTARGEAARCGDTLTFSAAECRTLVGEMVPLNASTSGAGRLGFTLRVPIGVIAAISPFNFPLNLVAHKLAPAIAAGCPVVLKPASTTPLSALALVELLIEAGMPADWVSVVTGSGSTIGNALVDHPIPRMVSFTGSSEVGWGLPARAPKKKHALELGSNSPVIVEPDADIPLVASKIKVAGFSFAGQSCISTQRVLVHRSVQDTLETALAKEVGAMVVGDPMDDATDVGPLISAAETERVLSWIRQAVDSGGRVVTGGNIIGGLLAPTVVTDVDPSVDLCTKEVFGPVVVVIPYDSFDEALRIANQSALGIHAGVFTNDLAKAMRAVRHLEFGGVLINDVPTWRADQQPYGGVRESGNTREGPAYTIAEMTELKFVVMPA